MMSKKKAEKLGYTYVNLSIGITVENQIYFDTLMDHIPDNSFISFKDLCGVLPPFMYKTYDKKHGYDTIIMMVYYLTEWGKLKMKSSNRWGTISVMKVCDGCN